MAQYIDEKDVYALVEPTGVARVHCSQIDELPRADVIPKSEFEALQEMLDATITGQETLQKALINAKQEWISVNDRLPEIESDARTWGELKIRKSVRVLCACVQKSGKTFVKEGYCEVWGDSHRAYWKIPGSIDKVTHWMPLPEAPKRKGGAG